MTVNFEIRNEQLAAERYAIEAHWFDSADALRKFAALPWDKQHEIVDRVAEIDQILGHEIGIGLIPASELKGMFDAT
jgi:hypothetical protein